MIKHPLTRLNIINTIQKKYFVEQVCKPIVYLYMSLSEIIYFI